MTLRLVFTFAAFAALLAVGAAFAATHADFASEPVVARQKTGYLRVSVKPCGSGVQLTLMQSGRRGKTWHFTAADYERHYCLPLDVDGPNNRIVGRATITATTKNSRAAMFPNQFGEDYAQLYPDRDTCLAGEYNDAEVTCENFTTAPSQEDFQVTDKFPETNIQWQNSYDGSLSVECGKRQAFYKVESKHDNYREDREWEWTCREFADYDYDHCKWSGYENDWDQPLFYQCPASYILTGVSSYHDNNREDRRWKFRCCKWQGYYTQDCSLSDYVNDWDGVMNHATSGPDSVFVGVFSYHDNHREDRRWKIMNCKYLRCGGV